MFRNRANALGIQIGIAIEHETNKADCDPDADSEVPEF